MAAAPHELFDRLVAALTPKTQKLWSLEISKIRRALNPNPHLPALEAVVRATKAALREGLRPQIISLQALVGSTTDLISDGRKAPQPYEVVPEPGRDPAQDLRAVVTAIPAAKREAVSAHINLLQELVGITDELVIDRRKTMWQEGGVRRVNHVPKPPKPRPPKPPKLPKPPKQDYVIQWYNCDPVRCTLEEAAEAAGLSPKGLAVALSRARGLRYFKRGEDNHVMVKRSH